MDGPTGSLMVRRFTDQLDGGTELERATISAQERLDAEEKRALDLRLQSYYEDPSDHLALDFSAAEIARNALQKTCTEMAKEIKPSKLAKIGSLLGKQRKSAKLQANEVMEGFVASSFDDLKQLVEGQESQWKSSHGIIYTNFQKLCRNVDAHKKVFELFPQQSLYASVLCGSLSLIVQASVNHEAVAETLSKAVTDITIESSLCVRLLDVIRTPEMREQLSQVYALMFRFYRDAIEWYLSSSKSKFFGSFNEKIKTGFTDSVRAIKETISRIITLCHIGNTARGISIHRDTVFIKEEVLRQRQNQWAQNGTFIDPGEFMQALLKVMYQFQAIEKPESERITAQAEEQAIEDTRESVPTNSRSDLREIARQMEPYVVGTEGHSLLGSGQFWMPGPKVAPVLQDWMAKAELPQTLWVSGPVVSDTVSMTSSKAAAMNVVLAAWSVHSPIISHFCERPHHSADGLTCEQSGMIGLVYSLIVQLLQFRVEDDQLDLDLEDVSRLDGSTASFSEALKVLYQLFACTPDIRFCVIHSLNVLEWGGGAEWCHDFLDVLFRAQGNRRASLKILLTTSGSSRVLADRIPARSQCFAEQFAHQVPFPVSRST
ncbi:uncharacterized protein CC84DRAFT_1250481 [Paraphaeosphaeria sporulosa]|uniref:DUF7708 domain-containing protein n=1 Tax=Paraphaeosphaeria sporulosa TaxID=1460663 RepID=A0A177C4U5_9PLEO|nr:uncharacterized protein CC84DRAFT_1250481 [Paraphaeosphaeria sporulosa]OAG02653.1 hypothetical protein CC84DRAFT_1250481 [Paraphaeosphaeria sporulosa]